MRKKNPVSDGESYCPKDVRGDEEILVRDINADKCILVGSFVSSYVQVLNN